MFAFQTDIDLETGIELNSTTEAREEAIDADDVVNGGYTNDDVSSTDETKDADKAEDDNSTLFIYQRTFNPIERADGLNSLELEDQDDLKEDSEETIVANEDGDTDRPDEDSFEGQDTNDENNNENEIDPDVTDELVASDEIKALTNENEEDANDYYEEETNDEVIV